MNDKFRPFHWPSTQDPKYIVEPTDENCPQAWDVYELEPHTLRVGQVVREGQHFQAWGRVWDTSLGTLVPLWFPGAVPGIKDGPNTDTVEEAVARIVQSWEQYTD